MSSIMNRPYPLVWLIFATFKRTEASLNTIDSLRDFLHYPNLHWHVADDGSGKTDDGTDRWHVGVLTDRIAEFYPNVTWHEMDTKPGSFNTGGNINKAIHAAKKNNCPLHMLVFDDWALFRPLDIRPHVDVLNNYDEVGFIRLSYMVPGLAGLAMRYDWREGGWMWYRLIRDWTLRNPWYTDHYMISTQPYVAHLRFFEAYGYHPENVDPGSAEVELGKQYNNSGLGEDGPQVLFPIGPCTTHAPWSHTAPRANDYLAQFGAV